MHFEFLVEDISGKLALKTLVPKILGPTHTYRIHAYKGIGHIPKNLKSAKDPAKRILLDRLPAVLQGYGQTFPPGTATVVVVCDLDDKDHETFLGELKAVLDRCQPRPDARFCLAIEEGEAWLLGDLAAVKAAYPNAKDEVLRTYKNDSICGTWQVLADAVYAGGSAALQKLGYPVVGEQKSRWAREITPHMDVGANRSPSFRGFRDELRSAS